MALGLLALPLVGSLIGGVVNGVSNIMGGLLGGGISRGMGFGGIGQGAHFNPYQQAIGQGVSFNPYPPVGENVNVNIVNEPGSGQRW